MTLKSDAKFQEKLAYGLENGMRNLGNIQQSTSKCQNWEFDGILLSKIENGLAENLHWIYLPWDWSMIK